MIILNGGRTTWPFYHRSLLRDDALHICIFYVYAHNLAGNWKAIVFLKLKKYHIFRMVKEKIRRHLAIKYIVI